MKHGDAKMKEGYAGGMSGGKKGGAFGPGGLAAASNHNPNSHDPLNSAPDGPSGHCLGMSDDGGMYGKESCEHRGSTYHFK